MRSLISVLLVAAISLGSYFFFLKRAAPGDGTVATQAITTTGVQMDLTAIAQAERTYFATHGSYASIDQLVSDGALTMSQTTRDGYTYGVDAASSSFMVTARHAPVGPINGVVPPHYPTLSIDQSMQIHQNE